MRAWIKRLVAGLVRPYIQRRIEGLLRGGDYANALRAAAYVCARQGREYPFQYYQGLAMIGLGRYTDALAIAERFEKLIDEEPILVSKEWRIAFQRMKCRVLYDQQDFRTVFDVASAYHKRYPDVVAFDCYRLLGAIRLGVVQQETACVARLQSSIARFDEPSHFIVLYSAYKCLGNQEQAKDVAQRGLRKYPDDPALIKAARDEDVTADALQMCMPSLNVPRCRLERHH